MDINVIRGLITLLLMIIFIGICLWAWSSKRQKDFSEASQLPLTDDPPVIHSSSQNGDNK